jgi:hypothetical protein
MGFFKYNENELYKQVLQNITSNNCAVEVQVRDCDR